MKPRRWIENLRVTVREDGEHLWYIQQHGLEDYLKRKIWKLTDYEVGQLLHPRTVYGKIRVPFPRFA